MSSILGIESLRGKKLRIAVYARYAESESDGIGSADEHYLESIRKEIDLNSNWTFAGAYIDYGLTAPYSCPESRLQDLLTDCREGKIDAVFVRSISRFAGNTKDSIHIIDELSRLEPPVGVYFKAVNVFSLEEDNALSLYVLLLLDLVMLLEEESGMKAEEQEKAG